MSHESWRPVRLVPKSTVKVATQLAVIVLLFGLAECAAGSCLSYGHSCWGAHGKRSGGGTAGVGGVGGVGFGVGEGVGSVETSWQQANPDDTRWFLSKLLANKVLYPGGSMTGVQGGPPSKAYQQYHIQLKDDEEPGTEMRDLPISRAENQDFRTENVDFRAENQDFRAGEEDTQDSVPEGEELLVMASPAEVQEVKRGPQKLRLFKIMKRASKNM